MKEKFSQKIDQIKDLIKKNKLIEAKELCLKIQEFYKENYEVINLLGIVELNLKNFGLSSNYFDKAIKINKNDPRSYNNLGILNYKIGKTKDAINYFNKAIAIDNTSINSYQNLAKIKLSQNDHQEAEINLKKILQINDKNLEALLSLSDILLIKKKYYEAKEILNKIIKIKDNFFEAYNNLGNIQIELNEIEDALKNLNKSNEIKPNKGAYNNIGIIYKKKKIFDLSILNFNKALDLDSNYLESLYNLGIVYMEINKFEKSIKYFNKIIEIDENYQRVMGKLIHCERYICDWKNYDYKINKLKEKILNNINCTPPWETLSIFDSEKIQLQVSKTWIKNNFTNHKLEKVLNWKKNDKKIKIGYFSSDFFNSAVANQIAEMIELHNKNKFEIIAFSLINKNDAMQKRLKNSFNEFINVENESSKDIVELSHKINLDIAVDLTGFTLNNRFEIFEKRCAPIQISYLGYAGTTGSSNIDYIIADKIIIPEESQKNYSEKIIYLPNTFMVNDNNKKISNSKITKSQYKIPENSFLLGCLNQHYKISPEIFEIWTKILLENKSCSILLADGNDLSKKNLLKFASEKGVEENRLIFAKKLNNLSDHLNRLKLVDLFIDTFPFSSQTTACDALFLKKPLIALKGNCLASRVSSSILYSLNLEELITLSTQDYKDKISDLINNKSKLKELNLKIMNNKKHYSIFDTKIYTQNLEKAYLKIYENFINKKELSNIYIN